MPARKRTILRFTILAGALLLALIAVGTAYAQEPGAADAVVPNDLNEVAARLMPLLVGAALIERTIEFLFDWLERAILDAGHRLNSWMSQLTGVVSTDFRQTWNKISLLTDTLVQHEVSGTAPEIGDATSENPEDWPLAKLEQQIEQTQKTLKAAENLVGTALKTPEYVSRKKTAAAVLSITFGILLALVVNLRLFDPLGVEVSNSLEGSFGVIDLILAGILMGLGTEWVHQVIGVLIKGKGLLGRASGGEGTVDTDALRKYADMMIRAELDARFQMVKDDATAKIDDFTNGAPPSSPV